MMSSDFVIRTVFSALTGRWNENPETSVVRRAAAFRGAAAMQAVARLPSQDLHDQNRLRADSRISLQFLQSPAHSFCEISAPRQQGWRSQRSANFQPTPKMISCGSLLRPDPAGGSKTKGA